MLLAGAVDVDAQGRGAWTPGVRVAPTLMQWSFATPVGEDSALVRKVSQWSLPVSGTLALGEAWTLDATGAVVHGTVELAPAGAGGAGRSLALDGLTDVQLRLVGRFGGDRLRVTLGVSAPTGATSLDAAQVSAIRVIGAPGLRMPTPAMGSGFGATAGLVVAAQAGEWALAMGAAYDLRGSYAPVEAAIVGAPSATDLDPADAVRVTLGADRLIGSHRLSLLVGSEVYGSNRLSIDAGGGATASGTYEVGPAFTALAILDVDAPSFRELAISIANRYRSSFRGLDGRTARGSSGNYLDAQARGVLGAPGRAGLVLGLDAHLDSGLEVDNSIATAAVKSVGLLVGALLPMGAMSVEPFARVQVGTLDTGVASTSIRGFSLGVAVTNR